ncbi:hypothetical protein [Blautia sp. HCN-1074]|jgi:hypothetical protein|uniref:hypothetical protein n=1 Tax=Blautia sp. HCN-1074 TaxID=3134667 RepID=UPI000E431C26|nr:hypothetical protein [Ruminococcus sp.]RGI65359.1 hypothetical protein DXD97_02480 [Ruminococcus sp. TM10-9AT]RGY90796.1 hypothetical protein DXA17_13360 [Ruminococcus sp. AM58-7XD]
MFKQKLKEILELTLEAADKTETYISYHYGNQSESLSVFVGEEVFTVSDNKHMEESMDEIREALLKLIK